MTVRMDMDGKPVRDPGDTQLGEGPGEEMRLTRAGDGTGKGQSVSKPFEIAFAAAQKSLDPEFSRIVDREFWNLLQVGPE